MKCKYLIITFTFLLSTLLSTAQNISVKSFRVLSSDQSARVHEPVIDQNGEKCALIKVVTTQNGFVWEGGTLGITKVEKKTGEYWLYIPHGSKKITIKHDQLGVLRDYYYPEAIKEATVYEIVLTTGRVITEVEEPEILSQFLIINSIPENASVYINDNLAGQTPFQRKYKEGEYTYRIEKVRYHNKAGKITLKGEKKDLEFNLKPMFGNIRINSAPEDGMQIILDDENTGKKTPATLEEISSGEHTLQLQSQWYQAKAKRITVQDEQTTTVQFKLEPAFAKVTITTKPAAKILIDNRDEGNGKWEGRLLEGVYTIKAEKDKYYSKTRQLEVIAGSDENISFTLEGKIGNADIITTPMKAELFVNGEKRGTTPLTLRKLLIGDYKLRIEKEGYGVVTKTLTIKENETVTINEQLPEGKEITIVSKPAGAELFVDGNNIGKTPNTSNISFGRHTIKLINGEMVVKKQINVTQYGKSSYEYDVSIFKDFTINKNGASIGMVAVKGGTFLMGCTGEQDNCDNDEKPVHKVTLDDFHISRYEITNAQYCNFLNDREVNKDGSYGGKKYIEIYDGACQIDYSYGDFAPESGKDNYPVIDVTFYGAKAFCEWKNSRLPTEAEWEYAARGGVSTSSTTDEAGFQLRYWLKYGGFSTSSTTYAGSNNINDVAWYIENSGGNTHKVGIKQANELGIYDMSGNVWEWCSDWYNKDYYKNSPEQNPKGPGNGTYRVLRGGSWYSAADYCRVAVRYRNNPDYTNNYNGFRIVR